MGLELEYMRYRAADLMAQAMREAAAGGATRAHSRRPDHKRRTMLRLRRTAPVGCLT